MSRMLRQLPKDGDTARAVLLLAREHWEARMGVDEAKLRAGRYKKLGMLAGVAMGAYAAYTLEGVGPKACGVLVAGISSAMWLGAHAAGREVRERFVKAKAGVTALGTIQKVYGVNFKDMYHAEQERLVLKAQNAALDVERAAGTEAMPEDSYATLEAWWGNKGAVLALRGVENQR
ncbi:MAG: hypothetical protein WAZ18_07350 [Alphaproteobacteria bacterium]